MSLTTKIKIDKELPVKPSLHHQNHRVLTVVFNRYRQTLFLEFLVIWYNGKGCLKSLNRSIDLYVALWFLVVDVLYY